MNPLKEQFIAKLKSGHWFPHHDCSICHVYVHYISDGERLFFDPGCGCSFGTSTRRLCSWGELDFMFEPEHGWISIIEKFVAIEN